MSATQPLSDVFAQYDTLLNRYREFWQLEAFAQSEWPWPQSAAEIDALIAPALSKLANPVAATSAKLERESPFWLTNGIQGRKLAQINGFIAEFSKHASCHTTEDPIHQVIEWCAGKGHLGRILSFQQQIPVLSVEWQANLCEQGQALAFQHSVAQEFLHANVMHLPHNWLPTNSAIVALHACGDLHRQLLELACSQGKRELFVAPCCYHLQQAELYQPLSQQAQQSALSLSRSQLKLAVQEQVTGGKRVAKLRDIEQLWRLVFDLYRAQITGITTYRSLPSVSKHWFSGELSAFIRWACEQQALPVLADSVINALIPKAHERLALIRSIDNIRQLFRRPLELWLLLDRALFLQEQNYAVRLQQFCAHHESPRNTLIIAKHQVVSS
ncbi:methyltransferase [Aliidiomarina sp.]|uniref:methyltransferase n=1 Tax=Aliidiomarina sp. TaxID=1872439 RepID=UPI003A4E22EC